MGSKAQAYLRFCNSFKGAVIWACFGLFAIAWSIAIGSTFWAVLNALCVVYWVWRAYRANNNPLVKVDVDCEVDLNPEQKQRIRKATEALSAVVREVDLELTRAAREKALADALQHTEDEDNEDTEES